MEPYKSCCASNISQLCLENNDVMSKESFMNMLHGNEVA